MMGFRRDYLLHRIQGEIGWCKEIGRTDIAELTDAVIDNLFTLVETPEQLDGLDEGTMFETEKGARLGRIWNGHASSLDGGPLWKDKTDALPLRVVWRPEPRERG